MWQERVSHPIDRVKQVLWKIVHVRHDGRIVIIDVMYVIGESR